MIPATPVLYECPKCGYKWWSKSEKKWVCCPKCFRKFKREAKT